MQRDLEGLDLLEFHCINQYEDWPCENIRGKQKLASL